MLGSEYPEMRRSGADKSKNSEEGPSKSDFTPSRSDFTTLSGVNALLTPYFMKIACYALTFNKNAPCRSIITPCRSENAPSGRNNPARRPPNVGCY